jgi:hypothetical protein
MSRLGQSSLGPYRIWIKDLRMGTTRAQVSLPTCDTVPVCQRCLGTEREAKKRRCFSSLEWEMEPVCRRLPYKLEKKTLAISGHPRGGTLGESSSGKSETSGWYSRNGSGYGRSGLFYRSRRSDGPLIYA